MVDIPYSQTKYFIALCYSTPGLDNMEMITKSKLLVLRPWLLSLTCNARRELAQSLKTLSAKLRILAQQPKNYFEARPLIDHHAQRPKNNPTSMYKPLKLFHCSVIYIMTTAAHRRRCQHATTDKERSYLEVLYLC